VTQSGEKMYLLLIGKNTKNSFKFNSGVGKYKKGTLYFEI